MRGRNSHATHCRHMMPAYPRYAAMVLGATALTSPFAVSPAIAQEGGAVVDREAIIVTAQRRAEALEDVPMTVTVISQDTLSTAGVDSVRDLTMVTSGYQLNNAGSLPQPAIRGVTTINAGSYENNVAVFVDGLYQTTPAILNLDLPTVENIQILKGPQGTLYGRNATGGAILIDTIRPTNEWRGHAELTYARFDDKRARGYIAGPISDTFGIMLSAGIRDTDGYFKKASRSVPGEFDGRTFGLRQESIRTKLAFTPSDNFRATVGYAYTHVRDPRGVHFTPIENVTSTFLLPGGESTPTGLGETAFDGDPRVETEQHEAFLKLELDTGIGTIESITGYTHNTLNTDFDFDGSYIPLFWSFSEGVDKTWQQAVNFNVDVIDRLDLIVGGTYYNIKSDFPIGNTFTGGPPALGDLNYPNPATSPIPVSEYTTFFESFFNRTKKAWAVYADATFSVTDRLSINVGGRYSRETQDVAGIRYGFGGVAGGIITYDTEAYEIANDVEFKSSYSKFTPRASIRYEITPRTSIYASYSKGFRGGEWVSQVPNDDPGLWEDVGQETVDAFEVGIKSAGRLNFELAGFYYDYKDLQVSFTQSVNGEAVVTLQSAPSAEIYGIEGSFNYEVVDNFNIRGGATWLHARYGDNFLFSATGADPNQPGINENSDPLKTFVNVSVTQDLSGQQMSRSPNFAAYLGFDYTIPNGDGGLTFAANAKYTDSYVVTNPSIWGGDPDFTGEEGEVVDNFQLLNGTPFEDRSEQQRARQGNYVLLNASVTWTDPSDTYFVRVWGNNLTDQKYRTHYNPLASGTYAPIGEPLTYGITLGYKFRERD